MKPKKPHEPTTKDKDWQKKVEERIRIEKVDLDHPKGGERFAAVIKRLGKKKRRD